LNYEPIAFEGQGGRALSGRLYGSGDPALVLSHMGRTGDNQNDWASTAEYLAAEGFSVLTYNRNGICDAAGMACSEGNDDLGSTWQEVVGAVQYLHDSGHRQVFVGGASIGAMASLRAAQLIGNRLAGVIWFAGVLDGSGYAFAEDNVSALECPLLIAYGDGDGAAITSAAEQLQGWTSRRSELVSVVSSLHGTDILEDSTSDAAATISASLLNFLRVNADSDSVCYANPTVGNALRMQVPGMHLAQVRPDLLYVDETERAVRMDVYWPAGSEERLPVVVMGGPPAYQAGKNSGQKIGWGQLLAASGLAVALFDIRSDNFQATPQEPSDDVVAAMEYLRENADELNIDAARMCTFGFSIGTAPWHLWAAMNEPNPGVVCNVVFYGVLDFQSGEFDIDQSLAAEYSAVTYLERDGSDIAPMFVAKAGRDETRINDSIDRFATLAESRGAAVTVLTHETGGHGFDISTPGPRTLEIIQETVDFLRSELLI
jgi:dienelactone hydrolase